MTDRESSVAAKAAEPYEGSVKSIVPNPLRFFEGGDDSSAPDENREAVFEFIREFSAGRERFRLRRRIGYRARLAGHDREVALVIPRDLDTWHTDFATVPSVFAWLVPRSGDHLPAALVHDALLDRQTLDPAHATSRDVADDVMRQAMADLGTGVVRRWLVWTAISMPTLLGARVGRPRSWARMYYAVAAGMSLLLIGLCGAIATGDVLGHFWVGAKWGGELPWMTGGTLREDLWRGAAGAVVIPSVLAALWGRFWRAGVIAGVALAFLLHVTVAVGALTVLYVSLEWLGRFARGRVLLGALGLLVLWSVIVFIGS